MREDYLTTTELYMKFASYRNYDIYKSSQDEKDFKEFADFLKTLLKVDLTIDQFKEMSEGEKIDFRRNFKIDQITKK